MPDMRKASPDPREGSLAAPVETVIETLQAWLTAKYRIDAAYRSFADRVEGPWRDSLVAHWAEHAGEERKQAYDLAMKIVGLGGDPTVTTIDVPSVPRNLASFGACLVELELRAIETAHRVVAMSGGMASLRVFAEEIMLVDTQHLDDLRRMLVLAGSVS